MKRKETEIISALAGMLRHFGEIELTASGLIMLTEINITPREAAWILKKIADEVIKDNYYNQNIYRISLNSIIEMMQDESGGISESE